MTRHGDWGGDGCPPRGAALPTPDVQPLTARAGVSPCGLGRCHRDTAPCAALPSHLLPEPGVAWRPQEPAQPRLHVGVALGQLQGCTLSLPVLDPRLPPPRLPPRPTFWGILSDSFSQFCLDIYISAFRFPAPCPPRGSVSAESLSHPATFGVIFIESRRWPAGLSCPAPAGAGVPAGRAGLAPNAQGSWLAAYFTGGH